jgi:23S rRNA pseudouridine2457 synthase
MRYIIFNKPYGVLSQFTDEGTGHPALKQYIN